MSTLDERNMTTIRPNLSHTYKVQVQVKREVHMKNMKENNDDFVIYTYCEILHTTNKRQLNLLYIQADRACGSFDRDRQTVSSIYYYCYVRTYVVRIMYDAKNTNTAPRGSRI